MNLFLNLFTTKPKIIVICGPTAAGKTSLSIDIAEKYNGEIISADSRQVYRGLDIGSAKVTKNEMRGIPHYLIDVADPKNIFNVQEFTQQAKLMTQEILARGNTPIISGGTCQYIDALVFNQSYPEVPPNEELRGELELLSKEELYKQIKQKDPKRAQTIDKHNKVRLVRALEIINSIGTVPRQKKSSPYNALFIGLDLPKNSHSKLIKQRIVERFEKQDMLQEAVDLHTAGLSFKRMESLGLEYRYMARHLQGSISRDEMIIELTTKTIQFAKRQRTWFKRNKKIRWFNPITDTVGIHKLVNKFLK
jgi:tRNA dimethylallyltransferase